MPYRPINDDISMRLSTILSVFTCEDCFGLPPGTRLVEDLNLDSLDLVQIAITIEEEFGIEIHDDDIMRGATVEQVTDYILNHLRPSVAAPVPVQEGTDGGSSPRS